MSRRFAFSLLLATTLVGCASGPEAAPAGPSYPPGQPPPGYRSQPLPGQPPAGQAPHQLGSAWTPFGELLQQIPPLVASWPALPTPAELPTLFPWAWGQPQTTPPQTTPPQTTPPQTTPPQTTPPQTTPPASGWPAEWVAFEDEVLRLTNQQRSFGASCGGEALPPAPPVGPHPQLRRAARGHGTDMAARDYFDHRTPEGHGPMARAQAAGYGGGFVGENIAAGQQSPMEVVQAWVDSPGHCVNLMNPRFRYLGVGYVFEGGDAYGHYWVQNFGG